MQSKMLLGVLSAFFAMALLFTLAVPKRPGHSGSPQGTSASGEAPAAPRGVEVPPEPVPPAPAELVDGVWQPSGFDVRMPAPEGWVATKRGSRSYLHLDPARPLQGNFSLIRLPNLYGKTLDGLLESNREELTQNPQFELESIGKVDLAGAPRVRVDYTGTPRGGEPVRFVCVLWLEGSQQMVLTYTVDAQLWEERGAIAERCLASLSVGPAPAAAPAQPAPTSAAPTPADTTSAGTTSADTSAGDGSR